MESSQPLPRTNNTPTTPHDTTQATSTPTSKVIPAGVTESDSPASDLSASDAHLSAGMPPLDGDDPESVRVNSELAPEEASPSTTNPSKPASNTANTLSQPAKPTEANISSTIDPATGRQTPVSESTSGELTTLDIKAAVNELDENIDEAFGQAAQSFWNLATSVTGTVSSAVNETPALDKLRQNVTSHLAPLDSLGQNLTSRLEALAPADRVANLAGSVKTVAQTVQRNAQEMERAILQKANAASSATPAMGIDGDVVADLSVTDPSSSRTIAVEAVDEIVPDGRAGEVVDSNPLRVEEEIAKVGELVGTSLGKIGGGLWSGLWGGEEEGGWEQLNADGEAQREWQTAETKLPTTRFEKKVFELRANPNTYCEPVDDLDGCEKWGETFVLEDCASECIEILSFHEEIAELYQRVVPNIVEEDTFWMRYFYSRHVLQVEEERRKRLLDRAENGVVNDGEDDDGWGDDDWDDEKDVKEMVTGGEVEDAMKSDEKEVDTPIEKKDVETAIGKGDVTSEEDKTKEMVQVAAKDSAVAVHNSTPATNTADEDEWGDDWE